jgi:hypothetical protein
MRGVAAVAKSVYKYRYKHNTSQSSKTYNALYNCNDIRKVKKPLDQTNALDTN